MIPSDKLAHFLAGIAVAALAYPFGVFPALLLTLLIACGKEVWDAQGNGTPEVLDALATLVGGALLVTYYIFIGV